MDTAVTEFGKEGGGSDPKGKRNGNSNNQGNRRGGEAPDESKKLQKDIKAFLIVLCFLKIAEESATRNENNLFWQLNSREPKASRERAESSRDGS